VKFEESTEEDHGNAFVIAVKFALSKVLTFNVVQPFHAGAIEESEHKAGIKGTA
jgi:hypothetical protein